MKTLVLRRNAKERLTREEADALLEDITLPKGRARAKAKLELAAKWNLDPSFSCPAAVYLAISRAWDSFESRKAEKLRSLVCLAIASGCVDFSDRELDGAVHQALVDVLMNEADGKSETARLYSAVLQHAPRTSSAWDTANRLNRAFGLVLLSDVEREEFA